jgi:hypothetical protein
MAEAETESRRSIMMQQVCRSFARRLAVCVTLLSFAAALGAQTPAWKTYSYSEDGFSAAYPSEPSIDKKSVPTDAGSFELRSYIGTDGNVAMFVGICDYGSKTAGKDADELLQGAKNGALENSKSHLLSETKTTFGIYHGLTFEAESDQAHFSARVYMVGSTLYQTLVVVPLGKPYADTARFLDSFQLIPRTAK